MLTGSAKKEPTAPAGLATKPVARSTTRVGRMGESIPLPNYPPVIPPGRKISSKRGAISLPRHAKGDSFVLFCTVDWMIR